MVQLEQLINTAYTKYETLTGLINAQFAGSDANEIDIIIDLNSIIKPLTKQRFNTLGIDLTDLRLSACIVNMIAHYRRFFRTRYSVMTNFYLIYNTGDPDSRKICSNYHIDFIEDKAIASYIYNNLKAAQQFCEYIPNSALYMEHAEISAVASVLLTNGIMDQNIPKMVITKDIYNYQMLEFCNCILRPKKVKGTDYSYMVNENNLMNIFCIERNTGNNYSFNLLNNYSLVLSMSRLPERYLNSLLTVKESLNMINTAVANGVFSLQYQYDIREKLETLVSMYPTKVSGPYSEIIRRYNTIDMKHNVIRYSSKPASKILNGLKNFYDPKGIQEVVKTYYEDIPVSLEDLDY